MRNLLLEACQIWFPGEMVWELWFIDRKTGPRLVDTCADAKNLAFKGGRRKRILALPSDHQVSLSYISTAFSEAKLLKGARDRIRREGLDCDIEGAGVQPVSGLPPRTLARVDAPISGKGDGEFPENLKPDLIVPAASLLSIPDGEIAIWTELRKPILGVGKNGVTIYYQELSCLLDIELAREIRDIGLSLQYQGLVGSRPTLHLWTRAGSALYRQILAGEVVPGVRTAPANIQTSVGMRPKRYREGEFAKSAQKKKLVKRCVAGFAITTGSLLIAGTYALAYFQTTSQRETIAELQPETMRLATIKSQWQEMAPAVDRSASVLEIWRKIFSLPSAPQVNVQRMAIGSDIIELTCEANSEVSALSFIDELIRAQTLSTLSWNYTTPKATEEGKAQFVLKGFKS